MLTPSLDKHFKLVEDREEVFHPSSRACNQAAMRQKHTQTRGQHKAITPEEKIRMTKENGREPGELWGGGDAK